MSLPAQITLAATQKNLSRFIGFVSEIAEGLEFSPEKINDIKVSAEEALMNIFNYAYPDDPGDATAACRLDENGHLVIEIIDSGEAFDLSSADDPDVDSDISSRRIGGLGIFLIKQLMDDVEYRREAHKNILKLTVKKPGMGNTT